MLVVAQYMLGYLHHRTFKKTQQTTKMAPVQYVILSQDPIPIPSLTVDFEQCLAGKDCYCSWDHHSLYVSNAIAFVDGDDIY